LVHLVVTEQDLAEAGAVRLHARVALVLFDRRRAAEDQAARATVQHSRPHVAQTGIDGDSLARHARLNERLAHAVGRPGFLGSGSSAFLTIWSRSLMGISRSTSRARRAWRISRSTRPALARLTSASASPVMKWATLSRSRLLYGSPQREMGMWITVVLRYW